jgi:hypothetical protein
VARDKYGLQPSERGAVVVALSANFLAFYLGAIFIERSGIFCGVTVFTLTALAGTIVASKLEKWICSFMAGAFKRIGADNAQHPDYKPHVGVAELIPHTVRISGNN